jgi:ATP-dependent DNA helicase RecQ
MSTDIDGTLRTHFGFASFRSGQAEAIQYLLKGHNTLVVMPTGSGKSLIFQLAALHLPGVTLVISPLISLMKDQVDSLEQRGIPATFINSTLTSSEQNQRLNLLKAGDYRIVYIAPERLRSNQFLSALRNQAIGLLAIDEAHCISEWGHDFRPDYMHIAQFRAAIGNPLTAALTATATPQVQNDIARHLNLAQAQRIVTGFNRPNLALAVQYVTDQASRLKSLQDLLENRDGGAMIIYTGTRRDAEEVAEFVSVVGGIKTRHYHAGLPTDERTRIQDEFMAGDVSIVAATNAFGMGIDRPDVRQVIHYSLPGSLEAYYQEAGRAGRDGLPARAELLYSPEDRALQEWFIENSTITSEDLHTIYDALHPASNNQEVISIEKISYLSGLQEVKVRVVLAELERAGVLARFGDEGMRFSVKLLDWRPSEIGAVIERHKQHQAHRIAQLERMIAYAESNDCRRQIILKHFGDLGAVEAEICCDNCQARQAVIVPAKDMATLTQSERVALIVLDTIRRMRHNVGKEKIALILKGSKARGIQQFGYDQHAYYGRLAVFSLDEIKGIMDQLLKMKYIKVIGGEYPVLRLTPQGEAAIRDKVAIPLNQPRQVARQTIESKKSKRQAGETLEYTAQLLSAGLSVEQIAAQRGLSPNTIYSHAAKLIMAGRLPVEAIIQEDVQRKIEAVICQAGSTENLYPIKVLLPDDIDYNVIRCVVEGWKLKQPLSKQNSKPTEQKNPSNKGDHPSEEEDLVIAFLSASHPRQLPGPWNVGWALGFHSQFAGAAWKRSDAGELAYRLKYQDDLSALPILVEQTMALIKEHPELARVDAVIPVPPSKPRQHDPVSSYTKALSQKLGLPYSPVLIKSRQTSPQKELHTLAQKRQNVAGAFDLQSSLKGKRLLVIDDLFDSGATLEEIFRLLRRAGASEVCVLTWTRTIHSDS